MGKVTFHPKILALPDEEFRDWFERTGLKGKPSDYRKLKKPVKKEEEGGE